MKALEINFHFWRLSLSYIIFVAADFFLGEVAVKYVWSGWFYFSSNSISSFSLLFVACNLLNLMHYFPQSISFSRLWFFSPCISRDLSFALNFPWLTFFCPPCTFRTLNKLFVPWCGMKMLHLGNDPARFKLFNRISAWWNPKSHDFVASVMTL